MLVLEGGKSLSLDLRGVFRGGGIWGGDLVGKFIELRTDG
jgi:hypothetical protein